MMQSNLYCRRQLLLASFGLCLLLLNQGCGDVFTQNKLKLVPVSGKVTLDGEPVAGAKVVFLPRQLFVDRGMVHPTAAAVTDGQGRFHLKTDSSAGALPGDYLVLISKRDEPHETEATETAGAELAKRLNETRGEFPTEPWMSAESIPPYYNAQSKLRFTVAASGSDQADFQLSIFDRPLKRDDQ